MQFEDRPQLPLTQRRKVLLVVGLLMWAAMIVTAVIVAPTITGEDDASPGAVVALWAGAIPWCVAITLFVVRQADPPDIFTAAFLITISSFATFAVVAALDARGTSAERDLVDTMFFGITSGALTALIVGAIALLIARLVKLPTAPTHPANDSRQ